MKLIGMLDSPYVRRVAICLKLLKLDFEHQSISVFSTYDQFARINPTSPMLIIRRPIARGLNTVAVSSCRSRRY